MLVTSTNENKEERMPDHQIHTARLIRAVALSPQTRHLEFTAVDITRFDFHAGQFISVKEPRNGGKYVTRAYSIASPPRQDASFDLILNRVNDGFMSNYLCDLDQGAEIHWHGPHGLFTLKQPVQNSIFICTGTGIAPFRSMLHRLFTHEKSVAEKHFWLIFGARREEDLYYADEFRDLQLRYPNFHYLPTLSRASEHWQGRRGYVQEHVQRLLESQPNHGVGVNHAYICGLHDMVEANRQLLLSLGWDRKNIFYERYD